MNTGCAVVAKPVSSSLPVCMVGEACMDYGIYYDDWSLLEAWVTDDWDYLVEEFTDDQRSRIIGPMLQNIKDSKIRDYMNKAVQNLNARGLRMSDDQVRSGLTNSLNKAIEKVGGSTEKQQMMLTSKGNITGFKDFGSVFKGMSKDEIGNFGASRGQVADDKLPNEATRALAQIVRDGIDPSDKAALRQAAQRYLPNSPTYQAEVINAFQQMNKGVAPTSILPSNNKKPPTQGGNNNTNTGNNNQDKVEEAKKETEDIKQQFNDLKYKDINSVRRWIAVKLARLRQWAKNIDAEVKAKGDKAGMFAKVKAFIARGIAWLTQKLHNLAAGDKYSLKDDDKFDYDAYKKQREDYEKSDEYKNKK